MKKNVFKATFAVVAIAAVGLGSYKAYDSYTATNMSAKDLLLAENVLALSDVGDAIPNYKNVTDKSSEVEFTTEVKYENGIQVKIEGKKRCTVWNTYCKSSNGSTCYTGLNGITKSCN